MLGFLGILGKFPLEWKGPEYNGDNSPGGGGGGKGRMEGGQGQEGGQT